jgi:hypothetical protein
MSYARKLAVLRLVKAGKGHAEAKEILGKEGTKDEIAKLYIQMMWTVYQTQ